MTRLPGGALRLLVLFHEVDELGASISVARCFPRLGEYGWTPMGWFPGKGPLADSLDGRLAAHELSERPIAFSAQEWRRTPGLLARLRRSPGYLAAVRKAMLRLRPSVVHANTLLTLPEAAVARSLGLPVVLQLHEFWPPGPKRAAALRAAARIADVIVVVSEAVGGIITPHAGRTPVLTVRNGVPAANSSGPRQSSNGGPATVGTIATVSRNKGIDIFLEAARMALEQRPDLVFEHVGQRDIHNDAGLDDEVGRLLEAPSLQRSVRMLGRRLPEDVLPKWDLFVLCSRREAFPLATLEAMAQGIPVIAPAVGGVPEQIDHLRNGVLVEPGDASAFASWIVRLAGDESLRAELGERAAQTAREFSVDRQADGLHRAYLAALARRFAPKPLRPALK